MQYILDSILTQLYSCDAITFCLFTSKFLVHLHTAHFDLSQFDDQHAHILAMSSTFGVLDAIAAESQSVAANTESIIREV